VTGCEGCTVQREQLHQMSGRIHFGKYGSGYFVCHTIGRHIPLNNRINHHKMATLTISVLVALNFHLAKLSYLANPNIFNLKSGEHNFFTLGCSYHKLHIGF